MFNFIYKYKEIIAGILIFLLLYFFAVSPIIQQNNRLKKEIKNRKKENEIITKELKKDSILLLEKSEIINRLEKEEQKFKDLKPLIQIKYEKAKTNYISNDLNERRRIFSKLANE